MPAPQVHYALLDAPFAVGVAAGALAGALLQRIADPTTTLASWLRAAPCLALAALILSVEVLWTDRGGRLEPIAFYHDVFVLLGPVGGVALVQIAAAVAGRGRPAPLGRAAPWLQATIFAGLLAWSLATSIPHDPRPVVAYGAAMLALAGALLAARRGTLPGGALLVAGAVAGERLSEVAVFHRLGWPVATDWLVLSILEAVMLVVTALLVRVSRLDRRSLARLGIAVGSPADLYAVFWVASALGRQALFQLAPERPDADTRTLLTLAQGAIMFATPFLVAAALRYLRWVLDVLAVRKSLREEPTLRSP